VSEAELLSVCLRLCISKLAMGGRPLDLDAENRLQVRMGRAVSGLRYENETTVVIYKRYRDARRLSELETKIIVFVGKRDRSITQLQAEYALPLISALRNLERDRIVELYLPG